MRVFQTHDFNSPPSLVEVEMPVPHSREVVLRIEACGLNFADTLMAKGKYQDIPPLPVTLGLEAAGRIVSVGDAVATQRPDLKPGQRVAVYNGHGGLAEFGAFPAERCILVPNTMSSIEAAGFQIAYGTSHLALTRSARLQAGETLLVTGATGGVGLTAVQIGKVLGARVIACARGADKLAIAREAGADDVIDSDAPDLREQLKAMGGVDVVYDTIGGPLFTPCFRACKPEARYLVIGFAGGEVQQIPANHLLVKNVSVIGIYWGAYLTFNATALTDSLATLLDWYDQGLIKPHVSHVLPLDQVAEGMALLRNRKSSGKVVITI